MRELKRLRPDDREKVDKWTAEIPTKLGGLAADLGIQVLLSSLPSDVSGQIRKVGNAYEIKINRHESRERQRFTLAHEIAHYLLHREYIDDAENGISDNVLYRSGQPISIEFEANRLAAELVMPQSRVEEDIQLLRANASEEAIAELARKFGVSKAALEIRLAA